MGEAQNKDKRYKECADRARPALICLVLILGTIAVLLLLHRSSAIIEGLAIVFVAILFLNLGDILVVFYFEPKRRREGAQTPPGIEPAFNADEWSDFKLVMSDDQDDEWMEKRVEFQGQILVVRVHSFNGEYKDALAAALILTKNVAKFVVPLRLYIAKEIQKPEFSTFEENPNDSKVITVSFVEPDAHGVEVTFNETPEGRVWACACKDDRFYNLGF